ncbi:Methyltransferase-like protein 25 like [Verticillium longisporum]|uniref:Methyltransferase-like protein 25 like n=1 Tax=Verticillium longisporum TaxID=100787 RepID=A0A8I2Z5F0_VERLO|nr:Methyltransferase-like protein 25 like [Verticillium longisporum]
MRPERPLPYSDDFTSPEDYVSSLLTFANTCDTFQMFAGGVHLLDFFTNDRSLYEMSLPADWQPYILAQEPMDFVDLLLRRDLDALPEAERPPPALERYIRDVRRLSLRRGFAPRRAPPPIQGKGKGKALVPGGLTRKVAIGMNPKKVHEVINFADYVDDLAASIAAQSGGGDEETGGDEENGGDEDNSDGSGAITHLVDFGSGQNYLGRTLALPPYNRHVVAVEGRAHNIEASRALDVKAGLSTREKVMRNKKMWLQVVDEQKQQQQQQQQQQHDDGRKPLDVKTEARLASGRNVAADLRPAKELVHECVREAGRGSVSYVVSRLESGDLTEVIRKIEDEVTTEVTTADERAQPRGALRMMAMSIHSCGNLSHYGIRSLVLNPAIHAVAIVGCCYNLMTEKLGPPTYKFPYVRPTLQAVNGRPMAESTRFDPEGFPISRRLTEYEGHGKMFLDRGVITKVYHRPSGEGQTTTAAAEADQGGPRRQGEGDTPFDVSTNPVTIGSLNKRCYTSFNAYVRGAVQKLTTNKEYTKYSAIVRAKMGDVTDEAIADYEARFASRGREVSAVWSLMAFSAGIVESLIVTDRWLFLEEADVVKDAWVETVFDYKQSPRNLVVVGIKK